MTLEDPLPRATREIDEEIEHTRQALRDIARRRHLAFLTYVVLLLIEAVLIAWAAKNGDARNSGPGGGAVALAFCGILPASGIIVWAMFEEADNADERFDIARATVIKRRMEL